MNGNDSKTDISSISRGLSLCMLHPSAGNPCTALDFEFFPDNGVYIKYAPMKLIIE